MNLTRRIRKEINVLPMMMRGYSRAVCNSWYKATCDDLRSYKDVYDKSTIKAIHEKGYLCRSISCYDLLNNPDCGYITDREYMSLSPYNSSVSKWISDMLTTSRVLAHYGEHFRRIYFSVIHRDGLPMFLRVGREDREYTVDDVTALLQEKGRLELRPVFWESKSPRYDLSYTGGELRVNGISATKDDFLQIFDHMEANYVIAERVRQFCKFGPDVETDHSLAFWLANDGEHGSRMLSAAMIFYRTVHDQEEERRVRETMPVDMETGVFTAPQGQMTVLGRRQGPDPGDLRPAQAAVLFLCLHCPAGGPALYLPLFLPQAQAARNALPSGAQRISEGESRRTYQAHLRPEVEGNEEPPV